uniref:Alternative protein ABCB8 n=1 Tax=Homo sapiens TaxID=9606 RepID=L8EAK9_HUMAN|nr:alternative protein ABCB8 [Homo sapiens]
MCGLCVPSPWSNGKRSAMGQSWKPAAAGQRSWAAASPCSKGFPTSPSTAWSWVPYLLGAPLWPDSS